LLKTEAFNLKISLSFRMDNLPFFLAKVSNLPLPQFLKGFRKGGKKTCFLVLVIQHSLAVPLLRSLIPLEFKKCPVINGMSDRAILE